MWVVQSFSTGFDQGIFSTGPLAGGQTHHPARNVSDGRKRQIGIDEQHSIVPAHPLALSGVMNRKRFHEDLSGDRI
jgi:hypothetical protein